MKTSIIISFAIFVFASLFASNATAQTDNQATFEAYLKTVYGAFETGGFDALSKYYASSASEISPDGNQLNGLAAIRANWAEAEKMFDGKPQFEYQLTSWRLVTSDVAVITWDAVDKFSMQGQKMEFKSAASALLRKEKGQWLIEFAQLTPKMNFEMPVSGN
jgi:ketosteroid isomerase-like protein